MLLLSCHLLKKWEKRICLIGSSNFVISGTFLSTSFSFSPYFLCGSFVFYIFCTKCTVRFVVFALSPPFWIDSFYFFSRNSTTTLRTSLTRFRCSFFLLATKQKKLICSLLLDWSHLLTLFKRLLFATNFFFFMFASHTHSHHWLHC